MKFAVRALSSLGDDLVFAPERWLAAAGVGDGVPLEELVVERRERVDDPSDAVVLDTTHARDGILDVPAALRAEPSTKSTKKLAKKGDLVVSRLRPYLRQIAYVHPRALAATLGKPLALSTEFYVLAPRRAGDDLAFLLPFLLAPPAQAILAAAQEGGHHPRVPRSSLLALRVPAELVKKRERTSSNVGAALAALYDSVEQYHRLLCRLSTVAPARER